MLESRAFDGWRRLTASVLDQLADDDPDGLAQVLAVLESAQAKLPEIVARMRQADPDDPTGNPGYSWAQVGQALGVSRQAARQRFGR